MIIVDESILARVFDEYMFTLPGDTDTVNWVNGPSGFQPPNTYAGSTVSVRTHMDKVMSVLPSEFVPPSICVVPSKS